MKSKKTKKRGPKIGAQGTAGIRASISFPLEMHKTLEGIAAEKKVSLAWVVRDAVEKYIADKWPLFSKKD